MIIISPTELKKQPSIHLERKAGYGHGKDSALRSKCIVGCIFNSVGLITREIACVDITDTIHQKQSVFVLLPDIQNNRFIITFFTYIWQHRFTLQCAMSKFNKVMKVSLSNSEGSYCILNL
jgi:hypothetical protein